MILEFLIVVLMARDDLTQHRDREQPKHDKGEAIFSKNASHLKGLSFGKTPNT